MIDKCNFVFIFNKNLIIISQFNDNYDVERKMERSFFDDQECQNIFCFFFPNKRCFDEAFDFVLYCKNLLTKHIQHKINKCEHIKRSPNGTKTKLCKTRKIRLSIRDLIAVP